MIFLDFEVFKHDWLVVFADTEAETFTTITNDANKLTEYYNQHKGDLFVGYNIRGYDQFIFKGIMAGFNPKVINDFIIVEHNSGYRFSRALNNYPLLFYDVMPSDRKSLKTLEGFMGKSIKETDVDFNLDRPLTAEELKLTEEYCTADVQATMEVFLKTKEEFDSILSLITAFELPAEFIAKTKAQLSAEILECEPVNYKDEWNIEFIPTLRIKKYAYVMEWFKTHKSYTDKLETIVAGIPHVVAWGGLHGARLKYHGKGLLLHIDVNSFYPAIMIEYGLLSRAVKKPEKYREIRDKRIEYKKAKNPLQAPYKIVLNGTYGICKDKKNKAYDPRRSNEVCINGQLLLLDLIEHLEYIEGLELIQSNTDGLIVKIPDTDNAFEAVDDVCWEWEKRTGMRLGFDFLKEIWQKDVNGYVFTTVDAPERFDIFSKEAKNWLERKGGYVKPKNVLDNDLPILSNALTDYFINGTPVETFINNCKDLTQFQQVFRVSSKYLYAKHNGKVLNGKVFRVFASTDTSDTPIFKVKEKVRKTGESYIGAEKFANCPINCFIDNGEVAGVNPDDVPKLNKQWYIQMAENRLKDYGILGGV